MRAVKVGASTKAGGRFRFFASHCPSAQFSKNCASAQSAPLPSSSRCVFHVPLICLASKIIASSRSQNIRCWRPSYECKNPDSQAGTCSRFFHICRLVGTNAGHYRSVLCRVLPWTPSQVALCSRVLLRVRHALSSLLDARAGCCHRVSVDSRGGRLVRAMRRMKLRPDFGSSGPQRRRGMLRDKYCDGV